MKKEFLQFLLLAGFLFFSGLQCALFAQTSTSAQSGNYNEGSTWVGGNVPAQGNNIIIKNGHTVTLDVAGKDVHDITIEAGAVFDNVNFDLRIQKASGNPTYRNDGVHKSSGGNLILYNNYFTRIRGTGNSIINFNVRDYGIQVLYDCQLTISGNLQHHINYTYASMTLIDNTEGGTLTINGNIIPQPDKAISITNGVFDFQGTTYVGNITVNGDVYLNSLDSWWAGTACGLANEGGLFYISGDLILGGGFSLVQNNQPNAEFTIAGDLLGPGLGDWEAFFISSGLLKFGGDVFPPTQNGNLVVDATSTVEYFGNAAQTIFTPWDDSFEDGPYNNLIINNSSEAGLNLSTDITVNNILTLNNGLVNLGDKNLILGDAATISGTPSQNSMIIATGTGELRKRFGSVGSFSFPVGDNDGEAEYAPVTVSFSGGTFANGLVSVNLKNLAYPGAGINHVKRYWNLSSSGISDYIFDLTFQYNESDVEGDESQIVCYRVEPTEEIFDPANTTLHVLTATNVTEFGTFTGKTQPNTNPPFAFNVTGGGEYCKDEPGIEVGLDNSEADAFYTLYRNNIPILSNVQGSGAAFSFGLQTAGIYTVEGTNSAGTNLMNGSAEVTEIMPLIVGVSITSDQNNVCHGTTVTFTASPENGGTPSYQWYKNEDAVGANQTNFSYIPGNGDQVQVVMTSSLTCVTGNPASSNVIAMTVNPNLPASVSISATQNSVCQGNSVSLTAFP
ncbi:MAG: G8 domain-containing protein [Bacteroidales bacterium]|nr:G8 domain-containing protein [Bacteroidales bacterium]